MRLLLLINLYILASCSSVLKDNRKSRTLASVSNLNCYTALQKLSKDSRHIAESMKGEVYLLNKTKIELLDFLAEGSVGRVFRAKVLKGPSEIQSKNLIIKIEKVENVDMISFGVKEHSNLSQFIALKKLEEIGIPAVKVIDASFDHSALLLEHIHGYNLKEFLKHFKYDEKFFFSLIQLTKLMDLIESKSVYFSDLHQENIMFDRDSQSWKVIDVSYVSEDGPSFYEFFQDLESHKEVFALVSQIRELRNTETLTDDEIIEMLKDESKKSKATKIIEGEEL